MNYISKLFILLDKREREFIQIMGIHKLLFNHCEFRSEVIVASIKIFLKRVSTTDN